MKIKESTIREIRDTADVAELIGEDVKLTRLGSSLRGLCPFHREKTPSFFVHPGKHIYTCFSCGAKGGAIQYVMESKAMDFPDAVEHLAARYGIKVEYEGSVSKPSYEAQMYRALELAAQVYKDTLESSDEAKKYLADRGISEETSKLYRLGFSGNGHLLLPEFAKKKISPEIAEKAGLAYKKSRWVERFSGRVMFPILDSRERVCGFGGRILPPAQGPKYVNSQDGLAYRKGSLLYGLKYAAEGIRNEKQVLVVEGYLDLLGLWEKGVRNVVATCGTALTEVHARTLKRLSEDITLFFDGDAPGIQSTIRSGKVLYAEGISPKALLPPDGMDPDDWAKTLSPDELQKTAKKGSPLFQVIEKIAESSFDLTSPQGKTEYVNLIGKYLRWITDPVERMAWTDHISQKTGLPQPIVLRAQI